MLIRLNEKWVIKTDRYQYMLCVDKGLTKFPKGLVAPLYSPNKFCSTLHGTINVKTTGEDAYHAIKVLENEQVHAAYVAACEKEVKLRELTDRIENTDKNIVMFDSKIEHSKNHYMVTLPIRREDGSVEKLGSHHAYPSTYGNAIMMCYSFYLKEHPRFNSDMDDEYDTTWTDVCTFMDETESMIKEIIDKN